MGCVVNFTCRAELEVTLGASEPTLAEYILDKYEVCQGSAAAFRSTLQKEAGIDGIHVDRLHSLISTLKVTILHLAFMPQKYSTEGQHRGARLWINSKAQCRRRSLRLKMCTSLWSGCRRMLLCQA